MADSRTYTEETQAQIQKHTEMKGFADIIELLAKKFGDAEKPLSEFPDALKLLAFSIDSVLKIKKCDYVFKKIDGTTHTIKSDIFDSLVYTINRLTEEKNNGTDIITPNKFYSDKKLFVAPNWEFSAEYFGNGGFKECQGMFYMPKDIGLRYSKAEGGIYAFVTGGYVNTTRERVFDVSSLNDSSVGKGEKQFYNLAFIPFANLKLINMNKLSKITNYAFNNNHKFSSLKGLDISYFGKAGFTANGSENGLFTSGKNVKLNLVGVVRFGCLRLNGAIFDMNFTYPISTWQFYKCAYNYGEHIFDYENKDGVGVSVEYEYGFESGSDVYRYGFPSAIKQQLESYITDNIEDVEAEDYDMGCITDHLASFGLTWDDCKRNYATYEFTSTYPFDAEYRVTKHGFNNAAEMALTLMMEDKRWKY